MKRNKFNLKLRLINAIIIGLLYLVVEVVYKASYGNMVGINNWKYLSLIGQTSLWQFWNGFAIGFILGQLNEYSWFYNINIKIRVLTMGLIITIIEAISGTLLNVSPFQLNLWTYEGIWGSFLNNQINIFYSIGWSLLSLIAIFIDDLATFVIFDEGECPNLFKMYKELFTFK